jgi:hypothetical protein
MPHARNQTWTNLHKSHIAGINIIFPWGVSAMEWLQCPIVEEPKFMQLLMGFQPINAPGSTHGKFPNNTRVEKHSSCMYLKFLNWDGIKLYPAVGIPNKDAIL